MNLYCLLAWLSCLFTLAMSADMDVKKGAMLKVTNVKIINATSVALNWRLEVTQEAKYKIVTLLIMLRQSHSQYNRNEVISADRNSYIITGLTPQTKYSVYITAYDARLHRRLSVKITVKTPSLAKIQGLKQVNILFKNSTSIEVKWKFPDNPISKAKSVYNLEWYLTSSSAKVGEVKIKGIQKYLITNLKASSSYLIHIILLNSKTENSRLAIVSKTRSVVPDKPNMTLEVYGKSNVIVRWQPPTNVIEDSITRYQISLLSGDIGNVYHLPSYTKFHYFLNIEKSGKYTIKLAAKTSVGWGKSASKEVVIDTSKFITTSPSTEATAPKTKIFANATTTTSKGISTEETSQQPPTWINDYQELTLDWKIQNVTAHSAVLKWWYSGFYSGNKVDSFEITLTPSGSIVGKDSTYKKIVGRVNATVTSWKIVNLSPFTLYRGQIAVIVNNSKIIVNNVVFTTEKLAPTTVESIKVQKIKYLPNQNGSYQVLVQLPKSSEVYGPVSYYDLIIIKVIAIGRPKKLVPVHNLQDLNPQFLNRLLGIQYRHVILPAYVTARFSSKDLPMNFTIGDNTTSNSIYNRPLLSTTRYAAILRAYVKTNQVKGSLLYTSSRMIYLPGIIDESREFQTSDTIWLTIITISGSALLLTVLLILIVVICRRYQTSKASVIVRRIHNKTASDKDSVTIIKGPGKAIIQCNQPTENLDNNDNSIAVSKPLMEKSVNENVADSKSECDVDYNQLHEHVSNYSINNSKLVFATQEQESFQEKFIDASEPRLRIITCKYHPDDKIPSNIFDHDQESGYVGIEHDRHINRSASEIGISYGDRDEMNSSESEYQVEDTVRDSISVYQMRKQLSQHGRSSFWI